MSLFTVAARAFKTHLEKRDINGNSITMENGAIELGCSNKRPFFRFVLMCAAGLSKYKTKRMCLL
ncbi:hypothetical protein OUZ56_008282 [Daphnia magna]|uniref:Uncharacterized protein n=1 Tax=Daphnia magna TaxID=35525 RepID=A0ABR0ACI5_9CRUS|nr:hypothetical protein OUZ56_008282 [Daphnia magna]